MNKTELFIQIPNTQSIRFSDTYLASSSFGLFLGLEFSYDVSGEVQVGQSINIDKDDKSVNTWIDGPATIIGITYSSIYATPSTLIFTDRPLQLPIVFTSGESGTVYLSNSIDNNWQQVDLSDNVAFPITFNIADVREINNRNGAYSKTISIPGTKNNNDVFKYIFDIQGVDNYDTRVKVKCNIVVETIPVLEGYIQLNSIVATDNKYWTYECTIFGENANFAKEIDQNARLEDLDFSEFNHTFDINSVTQSWVGDWTYGYYYPLIDYNAKYELDIQCSGISCIGSNPLFVNFFKPSIYVKQYWDKIFKTYGYTYESNFLNSEAFTNLIIPTNKKTLQNDESWRFNSSFKAGITSSTTYQSDSGSVFGTDGRNLPLELQTSDVTNIFNMNDSSGFFFDTQNVFTDVPLGSFFYKNSYLGNINKQQQIVLNIDYQITPQKVSDGLTQSSSVSGLAFCLYYRVFKNNTQIDRDKIIMVQQNNGFLTYGDGGSYNSTMTSIFGAVEELDTSNWDTYFGRRQFQCVYDTDVYGILNNDDEIKIEIGFIAYPAPTQPAVGIGFPPFRFYNDTRYLIEFYPTSNGIDGTYFFNSIRNELIENQPFLLNSSIPGNIKQIDFINSVIKMFNLYLYQDKINPKKIYIEPRDQFYSTTDVEDWSRKLDVSKNITQSPIVNKKKAVLMTYTSDKDLYNSDYKNNTNEIYGQYEYLTGNEIETSEQKINIIFSPSPLSMRTNGNILDPRYIYTRILDINQTSTPDNFNKVDSTIRILYRKKIDLNGSQINLYGRNPVSGPNTFNFYPYAGHLDDPFDSNLDLCFGEPEYTFFDFSSTGYTTNNLYNVYYKQFFEEIYGVESKTITAYVYLTAQDILDFDYRRLIYLDNISSGSPGLFRINKIEYDPFNKQSYMVEFIKVLNNFKYVAPVNNGNGSEPGGGIGNESNISTGNNGFATIGDNYNSGNLNVISGHNNISRGDSSLIVGSSNINSGINTIISGYDNRNISNNSLLTGSYNKIYGNAGDSSIIGGFSQSLYSNRSSIIGGDENIILLNTTNSIIIGGSCNKIGYNQTGTSSISLNNFNNTIISGVSNIIDIGTTQSNTDNNILLGGSNNRISPGVQNSIIIGGDNITITQSNTTYLGGDVFINGNSFIGSLVPIKYATYSLTDTEIKNSFTSPVTIITGATGIAYIPTMIVWETNYNTLQYTTNTNVIIKAAGADDPIIQQNGLLAFTYSGIAVSQGLAVGSYQTQAVRGADIQFSTLTGNPATGDGEILLTLYYIEL